VSLCLSGYFVSINRRYVPAHRTDICAHAHPHIYVFLSVSAEFNFRTAHTRAARIYEGHRTFIARGFLAREFRPSVILTNPHVQTILGALVGQKGTERLNLRRERYNTLYLQMILRHLRRVGGKHRTRTSSTLISRRRVSGIRCSLQWW
jgi:hypothetical protein